jgi:hypothetical protein
LNANKLNKIMGTSLIVTRAVSTSLADQNLYLRLVTYNSALKSNSPSKILTHIARAYLRIVAGYKAKQFFQPFIAPIQNRTCHARPVVTGAVS